MPAAITDKISRVSSGVRPVSTTVSIGRNAGNTTLACADLTGWTTTEKVHFVTYKIDGQSKVIAGSQSDWTGLVSGSTINNLTLTGGSDNGNAAGDIVELLPTAQYAKDVADHLLTSHNQDGTFKNGSISSVGMFGTGAISATTPFSTDLNPETRMSDSLTDFIASGLVWSQTSGLIGTMTAGVVYIAGKRLSVSSITSKTFSASQDTYIYVDNTGTISYQPVANNATTGMTLPANSIRLAKVVTNASSITSVVLNTTDPLGNRIAPSGGATPAALSAFRTYMASSKTGGNGVKVLYDTKIYDVGNNFNTSTSQFTAPVTGLYNFSWTVQSSTYTAVLGVLRVNSAEYSRGNWAQYAGSFISSTGSTDAWLKAGDVVDIIVYNGGTGTNDGSQAATYFAGRLCAR